MKNFLRAYKDIYRFSNRFVWIATVLALTQTLIPFANLYFSKQVVDQLQRIQSFQDILPLILTALITQAVLLLTSKYLFYKHETYMSIAIDRFYFSTSEKMMDVEYSYAEDPDISALAKNVEITSYSSQSSIVALIRRLTHIIQEAFTIVIGLVILVPFLMASVDSASAFAFLNSGWTYFGLLLIPIFFWLFFFLNTTSFSKKMNDIAEKNVTINIDANYIYSFLTDYNTGKETRLYKQSRLIATYLKKSHDAINEFVRAAIGFIKKYRMKQGILRSSFEVLVIIFVAIKTMFGDLSLGNVIQITGVLSMFFDSFSSIASMIVLNISDKKPLQDYYDFMDLPNHHRDGSLPTEKRMDNDYHFEIRNLSFKYPNTEKYVLKDVSFDFEVGKQFAIVGLNGSGKTTLVKLLCRLYEPTQGEILLNGINIQKYDYDEYVRLFSVVFQDFSLLSITLGENIAVSQTYDTVTAEKALLNAGFHNYENKMPRGMETILYKDFDQHGIEVSGGEAQKIALARAFYKNAPFAILDEPTAALDPISEYEIYEQTKRLLHGKTSIYISHRLSSCRFADKIIVISNGQIVEIGSHDELVKAGRDYQEMWNAQAQYYIDEGYDELLSL